MGVLSLTLTVLEAVNQEVTLFAAAGFLVGGIDDLAVDAAYVWHRLTDRHLRSLDTGTHRSGPPLAILLPAWDEADVIAQMLRAALSAIEYDNYLIYVGLYPNDSATIAEVAAVAAEDARIRPVIGTVAGPTTKAGCLNELWHALCRERRDAALWPVGPPAAIVLHDAEDLIDSRELFTLGALIDQHDAVQLPVLPLADSHSRFVGGHYLDEFAVAHGKQMPVRARLGAALPLSGTGCAIRMEMLSRIAEARGGDPFDAASLTEDYELGLTVARLGGTTRFVAPSDFKDRRPVAVRAFFPGTLGAAVRQKARWMTGIALAGWDRTGWARMPAWGDHWMRMRDRRTLVEVLVLGAAYLALIGWGLATLLQIVTGRPGAPIDPGLAWLLGINGVLLGWRLGMRALFVAKQHGIGQGLWSLPRAVVANIISLLAARRAIFTYARMLRGGAVRWDKTAHRFPDPARGLA